MRTCSKCGAVGDEKFNRNPDAPDGLTSRCKACIKQYSAGWYLRNKESHLAKQRVWIQKNPERRRVHERKYNYGITESEFVALVAAQNGVCAICKEVPQPSQRVKDPWHVDHDHTTGRVRGLLCHFCNRALGCLKDNPQSCLNAASYLTAAGV